MSQSIEKVAESHRAPWIKTVLTVAGTPAIRRSFIAGYNGERRPPKPATEAKWEAFNLGQTVRAILVEQQP